AVVDNVMIRESRTVMRLKCSIGIFFFQAEDGIRDYKVTGVQTCALPISQAVCERLPLAHGLSSGGKGGAGARTHQSRRHLQSRRSEERRVGKECRSRWSVDH